MDQVGGETEERLAISQLGALSEVVLEWSLAPTQRGWFPRSVPVVMTGFPFGILWGKKKVLVKGQQLVWPHSIPLDCYPRFDNSNISELCVSDRIPGESGDVLGTREFRHGDSLRRIHWAQTARHQRAIVTERQAPSNVKLNLMVDVDHRSDYSNGPSNTLEQIISIAASICESMPQLSVLVDCEIGEQRFKIGHHHSDLACVLDYLAEVPATGTTDTFQGCRFHTKNAFSSIYIAPKNAFLEHLSHRHSESTNQRFILVDSPTASNEEQQPAVCGCRSWIEVNADEDLVATFRETWTRACHE